MLREWCGCLESPRARSLFSLPAPSRGPNLVANMLDLEENCYFEEDKMYVNEYGAVCCSPTRDISALRRVELWAAAAFLIDAAAAVFHVRLLAMFCCSCFLLLWPPRTQSSDAGGDATPVAAVRRSCWSCLLPRTRDICVSSWHLACCGLRARLLWFIDSGTHALR